MPRPPEFYDQDTNTSGGDLGGRADHRHVKGPMSRGCQAIKARVPLSRQLDAFFIIQPARFSLIRLSCVGNELYSRNLEVSVVVHAFRLDIY